MKTPTSLIVGLVLLLGIQVTSPIPVAAENRSVEVISVEDVTASSDCELLTEVYADADHTQLVDRSLETCQPGTVVHSERMGRSEAEAAGLAYVVATDNSAADEASLEQIKPVPVLQATDGRTASTSYTSSSSAGCTIYYYFKQLSYWAEGGRVAVYVWYKINPNNCSQIVIYETRIVQTQDFWPGEDLYWDQEYYYGGSYYSWDMGCKRVSYSTQVTSMWYTGPPNNLFKDETINDTSLGCDWWGEKYTGSVYLTT